MPQSLDVSRVAVCVLGIGHFDRALTFGSLGRDWRKGPLPLTIGEAPEELAATAERRRTYLEPHAAKIVLGETSESWRAHRFLPQPLLGPHRSTVWAVELLRLDRSAWDISGEVTASLLGKADTRPIFAMIVHASIEPERADLQNLMGGVTAVTLRRVVQQIGLPGFHVTVERGQPYDFRAVLVTRTVADVPAISPTVTNRAGQWAFTFASGTLPRLSAGTRVGDFNPSDAYLEAELDAETFPTLSADWQAGVLRRGVAFIGLTADEVPPARGSLRHDYPSARCGGFFDYAEFYARTIYIDVFLFGLVQRHALHQLRDRVRRVAADTENVTAVRWIGRDVARFKETYWWDDVSRGGPGDLLLRAYHRQHGLKSIMSQINEDTKSLVDRVLLDAERRKADFLFGLTMISVFVASIATGATALRLVRAGHPWWELLAVVGGSVLVSVIIGGTVGRLGRRLRRRTERWKL